MELHKGGLISESSPKKGAKSLFLSTFPLVQSAQERDLAPSLEMLAKVKKPF